MGNPSSFQINLAQESPNVTGATVFAARWGCDVLPSPSFNGLLRVAYVRGYDYLLQQHGRRPTALRWLEAIAGRKLVGGDNSGNDMSYLPAIGVSVWGRSKVDALYVTTRIAALTATGFELRVQFAHDSRKYSGKEAILAWSPQAEWQELERLIS